MSATDTPLLSERELNEEIRQRLTTWRNRIGSRAIASAQLGTPETTIRNWEQGKRAVNVLIILAWHRAERISRADLDYLLFGEDDHI